MTDIKYVDDIQNLLDLNLHEKRIYEDFIIFTNENIVKNTINKYTNYIFNKYNIINSEFTEIEYISLYLIIHYPNILQTDDKLNIMSKNILNHFYELHNNQNNINIKEFSDLLKLYKKIFTNLIQNNRTKLINTYIELYINYEDIEKNLIYEQDKENIIIAKAEYYKLLTQLISDHNKINELLQKQRESNPETFYTIIQKEYWDKVKNDIKEEKNEIILKILNEFLLIFKSFIKNNTTILEELEHGLNLKYIKHIIDEKTINKHDIHNLFYFLVNTLKKFQCPEDDENLELWISEIENDMEADKPLYDIITTFFQEFYHRLIKLKNRILELTI